MHALSVMTLLLLQPGHTGSSATVRVTPTAAGMTATDAATALRTYSLDEGGVAFDHNASYALADTARFARATWDCGAWGTQGAIITQKILSLGGAQHMALARRWLLNTPVIGSTGEAFSTEGSQFHMQRDGKWEANAELIISALHYAKHAGAKAAATGQPRAVFLQPVSRFVCAVLADGTRRLLAPLPAQAQVWAGGDALCSNTSAIIGLETPSSHQYSPSVFAATMSAAFPANTEGRQQNSSGVALYQELTISSDQKQGAEGDSSGLVSALSIPLRQYKPLRGQPCWPIRALVYKVENAGAGQCDNHSPFLIGHGTLYI